MPSSSCHVNHFLPYIFSPVRSLASCFSWYRHALCPHLSPFPPLAPFPLCSLIYSFLSLLPCLVSPALRTSAACVCWCVLTDRVLTLSQTLLLHRMRDVSASPSITSPHANTHMQKDPQSCKSMHASVCAYMCITLHIYTHTHKETGTHMLKTHTVGPSGSLCSLSLLAVHRFCVKCCVLTFALTHGSLGRYYISLKHTNAHTRPGL